MNKRIRRWVSFVVLCGLCTMPGSGCLPTDWLDATFSSVANGGTPNIIHGPLGRAL